MSEEKVKIDETPKVDAANPAEAGEAMVEGESKKAVRRRRKDGDHETL